ncbi:MAG: hypothetical protein WA895_11795, partial [Streptosporangiaceae bacterium]
MFLECMVLPLRRKQLVMALRQLLRCRYFAEVELTARRNGKHCAGDHTYVASQRRSRGARSWRAVSTSQVATPVT